VKVTKALVPSSCRRFEKDQVHQEAERIEQMVGALSTQLGVVATSTKSPAVELTGWWPSLQGSQRPGPRLALDFSTFAILGFEYVA
jgi:hypothetical protein